MGLDINGSKFLLYAKALGVDFTSTAMIGRQVLHIYPHDLRRLLAEFRHDVAAATLQSFFANEGPYADAFLRYLGAAEVHSYDYSDYEGATHVHDMNEPVPANCLGRYSVVLDGGSLEHVFNFPTAIRNCMSMVSVGGHYLAITPANNSMGHGFYQFSPELFFRIFVADNGFQLVKLMVFEAKPGATWYAVRDPAIVGARVTLVNRVPTYIVVLAKRVSECPILASTPQQSDYVPIWNEAGRSVVTARSTGRVASLLKRSLPTGLKAQVKGMLAMARPTFAPEFYTPVDIRKELFG